jgi:hypothetical protein
MSGIRNEAEQLYAEWQLSARHRGRVHAFMCAITRARVAADAADLLGDDALPRLQPTAHAALREARQILQGALTP